MFSATEYIFGIGVALEMIFFNLITLHKCCEQKRPSWLVGLVLMGFTALIVTVVALTVNTLGRWYLRDGNGLLLLSGWFYIFPCHLSYKDTFRSLVAKIFVIWSYTYSVYSISVAIARLFNFEFIVVLFIVQSIFYLITAFPFFRFVLKEFSKLFSSIEKYTQSLVLLSGFMWFLIAIFGNMLTAYPLGAYNVVFLFFLLVGAMLSYISVSKIAGIQNDARKLEIAAYTDSLTGLRNRVALFMDLNKLLEQGNPFVIIFADINHLKNINDTYGHIYGDAYLKGFAEQTSRVLGKNGVFYRISGDEFVCVYTSGKGEENFVEFLRKPSDKTIHGMHYYGCGVGISFYPNDSTNPDLLLNVADKRMYEDKRENKPVFNN